MTKPRFWDEQLFHFISYHSLYWIFYFSAFRGQLYGWYEIDINQTTSTFNSMKISIFFIAILHVLSLRFSIFVYLFKCILTLCIFSVCYTYVLAWRIWRCFFFLRFRCADGYMGQRCEFKDLDGSYLRKYAPFDVLSNGW